MISTARALAVMADTNPARALDVVKRVEEMCDFIEHSAIQNAVKTKMVPVSMPSDINSVLKISVWVGLGKVGLWAALDAFAERRGLTKKKCPICKGNLCIRERPESAQSCRDRAASQTATPVRVGMWRGGVRSTMSVAAPRIVLARLSFSRAAKCRARPTLREIWGQYRNYVADTAKERLCRTLSCTHRYLSTRCSWRRP